MKKYLILDSNNKVINSFDSLEDAIPSITINNNNIAQNLGNNTAVFIDRNGEWISNFFSFSV